MSLRHAWTWWQRVLFRFAFVFWGLFCADDAARLCLWFWPWLQGKIIAGLDWPINHLVLWVGLHVFSLRGEAATFHPTGSGDTALGWTEAFVLLVLALLAAAVMANVVALNFGFDVPVKLYSSELCLMALFLLLPDIGPMWGFFFRREEAKLHGVWLPRVERRPLRIATYCVQALTIGFLLYSNGWSSWKYWRSSRTPLTGAWAIDAAQGEPAARHWARLTVRSASVAQAGPVGELKYLDVKMDVRRNVLQFLEGDDAKTVAELHWDAEHDGRLMLVGMWAGAPASLQMHRIVASPTPLETRGFHWVQEYPYNK